MKFEFNNVKMNGLIIDGAASTGNPEPQAQPEVVEQVVQETQEPQATQNGLVVSAEPMDSTGTEVAVRQNTQLSAEPAAMQVGGAIVDASEIGFGAYPKLKIENGEFSLDEKSAGKRIIVGFLHRRMQRLIKPAGVTDPTKQQMAYYTVQPGVNPETIMTHQGVSVADFKQSLREDGLKPEEVDYEMAGAVLLKTSSEVGDVMPAGTEVELQIPQASRPRFLAILRKHQKSGLPDNQLALDLQVGPKTAASNGKTYNPWVISAVQGTVDQVCTKFNIDLNSVSGTSIDDLDF